MSIYDNVASGLKLMDLTTGESLDEIVHGSLDAAALWDEVKDQLHKKSGASLSGGQQAAALHCAGFAVSRRFC